MERVGVMIVSAAGRATQTTIAERAVWVVSA